MSPTVASRWFLAGALLSATALAFVLPLVLPMVAAVPLALLGAAALGWAADAGLAGRREAAATSAENPAPGNLPPATPPPPAETLPPPAPEQAPPIGVQDSLGPLVGVSWDLHQAIIARMRTDMAPLSASLFGVKDNLQGLLKKSSQLESSFRTDSSGLRETVTRFETQSRTIAVFAQEMDRSVQMLETSSAEMGTRLGAISQAIQQINDVAERIKVLSINASIEAARAGQQGAGFKVISQEVRRLAEDTNQFSGQAEKTITDALGSIQQVFQRFIVQYQGRADEIHQIRATSKDLEAFLKGLFVMIEGIFQEYDGFVSHLEQNFDAVSPTLQQVEIGTQQIENAWKGLRDYLANLPGGTLPDPTQAEIRRLLETFSRHITTPHETEVVGTWAQNHGITLESNRKNDADDITMF